MQKEMNEHIERPLRVLAADDSAVMRSILRSLFLAHSEELGGLPSMELTGVARDGHECLESIIRLRPDALILDLEMPKLDGLGVLKQLSSQKISLPVIMCSSHTKRGAAATFEALACGASDYIMKPAGQPGFASAMSLLSQQLLPKLAALTLNANGWTQPIRHLTPKPYLETTSTTTTGNSPAILVIGASTGGPVALEQLLSRLASDFPLPILITQHMPKLFTGVLAERLNRSCPLDVEEARHGEPLTPGKIWLAPGDRHLEVMLLSATAPIGGCCSPGAAVIKLHAREPLHHCRPAVDYLFHSAAQVYGSGVLALILTGMGSDGLDGARAIHKCGGTILAQDESTSAVWGMPGRVVEAGIATRMMTIPEMAREVNLRVNPIRSLTPSHHWTSSPGAREVIHGMY